MRIDYAARARALVGVRFRPQGRDENGLDCVGVAVACYGIPAETVSRDYRMRGDHVAAARQQIASRFRRIPSRQLRAGDLMLLAISEQQVHLAVRTEEGFVHAHAGLRRVVETPGMPEWQLTGVYRKRWGR